MKKTMILVIAFVLSLFILPSALAAEGETFSYEIPGTTMSLRYKIMEDDTIEIVRSSDVAGELVIPAEIDGKAVTSIGTDAFYRCTELTDIDIPDSVASIGELAFYGCTGLTDIDIPDSVTSIGSCAFEECTGLKTARYSQTLPIDTHTFYLCDSLTEVYCDGKLLPKLGTPSDLAWNIDHNGNPTNPGYLYFARNYPTQEEYASICVRKVDEPSARFWWSFCFWRSEYVEGLIDTDYLESGEYYFEAYEVADGKNYWRSEIATSDIWTYVKPDERLNSISGETLAWDGENATWKSLDDEENVFGYRVYTYYSPSEDGDFEITSRTDGLKKEYIKREGNIYFEDKNFYRGNGFYYFTVQAISNNPSVYLNSEESSPSPVFHLHDVIADVNGALCEISEDADVREEVQKIGTADLTTALRADKNELGGTADILKQLEEKTGVAVKVDAAEGFETLADTSIVGAALNDVPEGTDTITLNIDAPEKEHVIPTQYKNTVALRFSMGLDGVMAQEDLKVPVKVTLPIPNTINRDFLVLLHYGQDGSMETVEQYQFQKDGKWYVSIVLTHFSDFVMTETAQKEEGNKPSGDGGGSSSGGSTGTSVPSGGETSADTTPSEDIPPIDEPPAFVLEEVFDDIAKTAWYYDAVEFVAEKGLMNGVGNKQFAPDEYITRASIAQILYNSEENRDITISNPFDDVIRGSWYEDAVVWAAEQGIVTGFNANTFGPDGLITREQFAVMLWRHAGKPTSNISLDEFTDCDTAGEYAIPALKWAVESEIIKGAGEGILAPLRNATRAETAQMLMRYFQ